MNVPDDAHIPLKPWCERYSKTAWNEPCLLVRIGLALVYQQRPLLDALHCKKYLHCTMCVAVVYPGNFPAEQLHAVLRLSSASRCTAWHVPYFGVYLPVAGWLPTGSLGTATVVTLLPGESFLESCVKPLASRCSLRRLLHACRIRSFASTILSIWPGRIPEPKLNFGCKDS
jgi:hypothetical protein